MHRPSVPSAPLGVPGSLGVASAPAVPVHPAALVSAPSLFHPFASDPSPSSLRVFLLLLLPSPPVFLLSLLLPLPIRTLPFLLILRLPSRLVIRMTSRRILLLTPSLAFLTLAFPQRFWIPLVEFCRMMSFIGDLFPQAAGSPSVTPPPCALFKDFFSSPSPPSSPVFLNWFERIRSALSEADSRLASLVASGRGDFLFLPSRSSTSAVHGDFALGGAAPVNSSLLSNFERCLKPSNHVGMSIREAAAFEASLRSQAEALSHSMWVLSALLAFVWLQNFAPEDSSLFNTLVTSLSKSLAHQASLTATHTAFLGLKWRQFYLSPSCLLFRCQQAGDVVISGCLGILFVL